MPVRFDDAMKQVCPVGFWRNLAILDEMVSGDFIEWEQVTEEYREKYPVVAFLLGVIERAHEKETDTELAFSSLVHCLAMIWTSDGRCGEEADEYDCEFQKEEGNPCDGKKPEDGDWFGEISLN